MPESVNPTSAPEGAVPESAAPHGAPAKGAELRAHDADHARLVQEIRRRKTFAIISHPDAGKTTLTEKLLLYGGAIQLAGAVKAKRGRAVGRERLDGAWSASAGSRSRRASSSSPTTACKMNLLDTPGHADFSEDTYRTLHAADRRVMLLDCAKGVEPQTKKLFRVCRQRKMPIFTFVNKMDRPGREPFDLVGEVESVLGIGVVPDHLAHLPRGTSFAASTTGSSASVYLFDAKHAGSSQAAGAEMAPVPGDGPRRPVAPRRARRRRLRPPPRGGRAARGRGRRVRPSERFEAGEVSPMFFGSAMNNFGLAPFLDTFCELMPHAVAARQHHRQSVVPSDEPFSGFVFKIQANMDKAHRDRVAFLRICSGRFERGMKVLHVADRTRRSASRTRPRSSPRSGRSSRRHSPATSSASTTRASSRSATR